MRESTWVLAAVARAEVHLPTNNYPALLYSRWQGQRKTLASSEGSHQAAACHPSQWSNLPPGGCHLIIGKYWTTHRILQTNTIHRIPPMIFPFSCHLPPLLWLCHHRHNIQILPSIFHSISFSQSNKLSQSRKLAGHKLRTIYDLRASVCIPVAHTCVRAK